MTSARAAGLRWALASVALALGPLALAGPACAGRPRAAPASRAELWFGGDVHLSPALPRVFDPEAPGALAGATGVVNLEGPVVPDASPRVDPEHLYNPARALAVLRAAGVRVATLANNHRVDGGPDAPARTAAAVARAGLVPVGEGGRGVALVRAAGGLRVAIAAFDLSRGEPPSLAQDLAAAARAAGASPLVVTFHVAAPRLYLPTPTLRSAVARALAAGARVVAAHGTHAVGPVERRGGAVIAWGLGNLLFACPCSRETEGSLLRVTLDATGAATRAGVVPVEAGLDGRPAQIDGPEGASLALFEAIGSPHLARDRADPIGWF